MPLRQAVDESPATLPGSRRGGETSTGLARASARLARVRPSQRSLVDERSPAMTAAAPTWDDPAIAGIDPASSRRRSNAHRRSSRSGHGDVRRSTSTTVSRSTGAPRAASRSPRTRADDEHPVAAAALAMARRGSRRLAAGADLRQRRQAALAVDQEVPEPVGTTSRFSTRRNGVPERVSSWVSSGTRRSRTGRLASAGP